jgi:hypothetical protein
MYNEENLYSDINNSYFIAEYDSCTVSGTGLLDSGWDALEDGIIKLSYHLINNVVVEIPEVFDRYLHLIEVSQSVADGSKVFHYVYIYGQRGKSIISYRIALKSNSVENIGDVKVTSAEFIKSKHWKEAACQ